MCIAIMVKKGLTLKENALKLCWDNNPDGAGFAWPEDGKVKVFKEVKDFDKFYTEYKKVKETYNGNMLLHFRIATHGEVCEENCHPFLVNDKLAFIHNGIISNVVKDKKESDTILFNKKVLQTLPVGFHKNAALKTLMEEYVGRSKLVFLDADGEFSIVNESLGTWDSECWFSNDSYKTKKVVAPPPAPYVKPRDYSAHLPKIHLSYRNGGFKLHFKTDSWEYDVTNGWKNLNDHPKLAYEALGVYPEYIIHKDEMDKAIEYLKEIKVKKLHLSLDQKDLIDGYIGRYLTLSEFEDNDLRGMMVSAFQNIVQIVDYKKIPSTYSYNSGSLELRILVNGFQPQERHKTIQVPLFTIPKKVNENFLYVSWYTALKIRPTPQRYDLKSLLVKELKKEKK